MGVVVHGRFESGVGFSDRYAFAGLHGEVGINGIQSHVLAGHAGQQDGSPLLGEQRKDPFHRKRDAVLPVGDQHQVNESPQHPADAPFETQAP